MEKSSTEAKFELKVSSVFTFAISTNFVYLQAYAAHSADECLRFVCREPLQLRVLYVVPIAAF